MGIRKSNIAASIRVNSFNFTNFKMEKAPQQEYTLTFMTNNYNSNQSKDAKVYIRFFGNKGSSGYINVECPKVDPLKIFDKANKQTFTLCGEDVGIVNRIKVVHDDDEDFKWELGYVYVKTKMQRTKFTCNSQIPQMTGGNDFKADKKVATGSETYVEADEYSNNFRNIQDLKKKATKPEEQLILKRAEEIMDSDDFQTKKAASRAYLKKVGYLDDFFEERMDELAMDMAERELERSESLDKYERAYLPADEQRLIPKLNASNNLCYKYLRDNGSDWEYNPKDFDDRYKARLYRRFDTFDKDSDGIMTIDEVMSWADRMKLVCDTNDTEVEKVRQALYTYFSTYGLSKNGLQRENWVEAHCTMGAATFLRRKKKDTVLMETLANAYFEVLDEDDDGYLDMEELKKMMNVFRVPEEAAYPFFEFADKNQDGKLENSEMHKLFMEFWFDQPYNADLDGIFAYKY